MLDPKDMYYIGYIMATIIETCKLTSDCKECPFNDKETNNSCMFGHQLPNSWDLAKIFLAFAKRGD